MGNETSLAQKTKIEQSFYTFLEIVYLEVSKDNSVSQKFLYLNQNSVSVKIVCHGAASRGVLLYVDFHASGGVVNKYENYEGIACHNYFKTGPSIYYLSLIHI